MVVNTLSTDCPPSPPPVMSSDTNELTDPNISSSILDAQKIAEAEINANEIENKTKENDEQPPVVPTLLRGFDVGVTDINSLAAKTQELKAKGQQLNLLLLKAETFSYFIKENQERCRRRIEAGHFSATTENDTESQTDTKSRKRKNSTRKSQSNKRSRGKESDSPGGVQDGDAFKVTSTLVGGTLMPYQVEGLKWLLSLWENGLSGILADEMGLGKTIQIISLIAQLRAAGTPGPFLIAGPLATLPNWMNEFKKWLPSCPVVLYHGSKEERAAIRASQLPRHKSKDMSFPVVVTSFEICMIDRPALEQITWQYIILDEGHRIKNRNCRLVRELKQITATSRLLLTGTPIQNTLEELWSLLNFVNPMIFDDLEVFQSWFGFRNIGRETQVEDIVGDEARTGLVSKLHEILRPFLLRRMKRDVISGMPSKREVVIYCGMSSLQREYYARVLQGSIRETLVAMGVEGARDTSQMNSTMNLRKVCNHPFLFGEPRDSVSGKYLGEANPALLVMASGKFKLLDRMLPVLREGGHRVLIFSQMTRLLDILQDYLAYRGYGCCRIDGSTKVLDRQAAIDSFNQDPDMFVFLLSTRAGGLGINLASADTAILFDSDWNPHQDLQAQDRCHRIGQKKDVAVYRFLTAGSVEIEMMEKQISKKKLDRMTIHGGDFRQAGRRQGEVFTVSHLRKLLEDDVRNLGRTTLSSDDISDEELMLLLNREKLFAEDSETGDPVISSEGQMYDIVTTGSSSSLQGIQ